MQVADASDRAGLPSFATGGSSLRPDVATIERWWRRYERPGEVYEVRITDTRRGGPARLYGKVAGCFTEGPALVKALSILDDLGWPPPEYTMMSGNGGALVYLVDLPNDDGATAIVEGCLAALAEAFGTDAVDVDRSNTNAARLTKVPGSVAAKGDDVPDLGRVWRLAAAEPHDDADVVPQDRLEDLAAGAPKAERPDSGIFSGRIGQAGERTWTVTEVLRRNGIAVEEKRRQYGTIYALDRCLTSVAHDDGAAIIEKADGALCYRCHHNSCRDKRWEDAKPALGLPASAGRLASGRQGGTGSADGDAAPWPTPDPIFGPPPAPALRSCSSLRRSPR